MASIGFERHCGLFPFSLHLRFLSEMDNVSPAPASDRDAENFVSLRQEVGLRMLVTHLPLNRTAPAFALAAPKVPREICLAPGADVLKSDTGAGNTLEALQNYLAPAA